VGEAAGFIVLGAPGPAPLGGHDLDLGAAQRGEQAGEVLVVGRLGEGEGVADLLEAQVAGHEPGPDLREVLEGGGGSHPLAGGGARHLVAVGEPVGHRQRPVGSVVLEGVGGKDHPEGLVEQDVALGEEVIERDLALVGRALLVAERLIGHGSPPGHVVSTVGDPQITPGSRRGRRPDYTPVVPSTTGRFAVATARDRTPADPASAIGAIGNHASLDACHPPDRAHARIVVERLV